MRAKVTDEILNQEYGDADKELASIDPKFLFKILLTMRETGGFSLSKASLESYKLPDVLPSWLSEEEIEYFASKFHKSGFTGGINFYRCLDL